MPDCLFLHSGSAADAATPIPGTAATAAVAAEIAKKSRRRKLPRDLDSKGTLLSLRAGDSTRPSEPRLKYTTWQFCGAGWQPAAEWYSTCPDARSPYLCVAGAGWLTGAIGGLPTRRRLPTCPTISEVQLQSELNHARGARAGDGAESIPAAGSAQSRGQIGDGPG